MAGVKGKSGRKSKLREWSYHQIILNGSRQIIEAQELLHRAIDKHGLEKILQAREPTAKELDQEKAGKKIKRTDDLIYLRRLYYRLLDIGRDFALKAVPSKIELPPDPSSNPFMTRFYERLGVN